MFGATNKRTMACALCAFRTVSTCLDAGGHCEACATDLDDVDRARAQIHRYTAAALRCALAARDESGSPRDRLLAAIGHYRRHASRERNLIRFSLEAIRDRNEENADVHAPLRDISVAS